MGEAAELDIDNAITYPQDEVEAGHSEEVEQPQQYREWVSKQIHEQNRKINAKEQRLAKLEDYCKKLGTLVDANQELNMAMLKPEKPVTESHLDHFKMGGYIVENTVTESKPSDYKCVECGLERGVFSGNCGCGIKPKVTEYKPSKPGKGCITLDETAEVSEEAWESLGKPSKPSERISIPREVAERWLKTGTLKDQEYLLDAVEQSLAKKG